MPKTLYFFTNKVLLVITILKPLLLKYKLLLINLFFFLILRFAFMTTKRNKILTLWTLTFIDFFDLSFIFLLDWVSLSFIGTVILISFSIILFTNSYISHEPFFMRFSLILLSFVLAIVFLILRPSLFRMLIGWDGLGVTSFLLVIYYQNTKASNAGLITVFINRIGDVIILIILGLFLYNSSNFFFLGEHNSLNHNYLFYFIFIIAACTKSAQIPFSAWLPAAIAAPTPVSSLVHSSTLVTAGVYLLIRIQSFSASDSIILGLVYLGLLTTRIARVSALTETDIKKIVALSTLSQIGIIVFTVGLKLYFLAYFHLLCHAFFKALLFINVGNLIHNSKDYQDLRKISCYFSTFKITSSYFIVATIRIIGFPFMCGFYSKDRIMESIMQSTYPVFVVLIVLITVSLTVIYSFRLIIVVFFSKNSPSQPTTRDNDYIINYSMSVLFIPTVLGGSFFGWVFFPSLSYIPTELKNMVLIIILRTIFMFFFLFNTDFKFSKLNEWFTLINLNQIRVTLNQKTFLFSKQLHQFIDQLWTPYIRYNNSIRLINDFFFYYEINSIKKKSIILITSIIILLLILIYLCISILVEF